MFEKAPSWLQNIINFCFGFVSCFGLFSLFIMQPPQMMRWSFAPGTNEEKVARALDPQSHLDELRERLVEAQSNALRCTAAKNSENGVRFQDEQTDQGCVTGLDGLYDQVVHSGQATTFLGGRMHISVEGNVQNNGCYFFVKTATNTELKSFRWGADVEVTTDIGKYRVVPKAQAYWWIFPDGCTFDIVKVLEAAKKDPNIVPSLQSSGAPKKN